MKGFILQVNDRRISGAIDEGITSIIITCEDEKCRVNFGSMNKSGTLSYTWYANDMKMDDCLTIFLEEISSISEIAETRNYDEALEESQKRSLKLYRKLKKELIEEGYKV